MACEKKQKGMVSHHRGTPTSKAPPATKHLAACSAVPSPGKAQEARMDQNSHPTRKEEIIFAGTTHPSRTAAAKHPGSPKPPDNLSPDITCKGIRVTLDNNSMWNEFWRCKTEMILTRQGSRMFPYCRFRISGLQPSRKYFLMMDIQPLDHSSYKWSGKKWQVAGKAECHKKSQPFTHPESPSTGQHWMQNPVSFYKLKLTNNASDPEGNIVLHPMHRYCPRLHVVQTERAAKDINLNGPCVVTFTFPQTEFTAVTSYQNSRFTQLKVEYNPFAKGLKEDGSGPSGLKLKLGSCKNGPKDGGTTTNEQHLVKKSLKSLLANHKPRSSKTDESKHSKSGELQEKTSSSEEPSSAGLPGDALCNGSQAAPKLFSELIREAHVSLQRCNVDQLSTNNSDEPVNSRTGSPHSNGEEVLKADGCSLRELRETSSAKKREPMKRRRSKQDGQLLNNHKDSVRTECSENIDPVDSLKTSDDSNHRTEASASSETRSKRPAPLPLPALARFLKQHSVKSKKPSSKNGSPSPVVPPDALGLSQSSKASYQTTKASSPSKDLGADGNKRTTQAPTDAPPSGPAAAELPSQPTTSLCLDSAAPAEPLDLGSPDHLASVSVSRSPDLGSEESGNSPIFSSSDKLLLPFGTFSPSDPATSSPVLSPLPETVLDTFNSPRTESNTDCIKSDSLLPDSECSSLGFEPMSPASSPEALPPLPASLALELDSTTSDPPQNSGPPEDCSQNGGSASAVLKWHTVLPPTDPFIDETFTTFQSTSQTRPDISPCLLPSASPALAEPQTLETSTLTDTAPSLQDNEQSLPFPGDLSPLALQLTLSPTFSSLDGEGLSPTPSIADLVHFFSTNEDLGMGVEFSNSEAVADVCPPPPPPLPEASAPEPSETEQPPPPKKRGRPRKKTRRRKTSPDRTVDDSTYSSLQPNLEEVEEQLFISFTSKESLKRHVPDLPEESVVETPPVTTAPEAPLLPPADSPEDAEKICGLEKTLLRDLKLMRHRQAIHPVLQEVGLKMNLLDHTLAVDLRYLGVHLPVPAPSAEPPSQELSPPQGVSAAFVSRTGKTTDVTQIKGWRDKFTASEAPPLSSSSADAAEGSSVPPPAAGPSSDPPKKNLSAFCSDMLDQYLENEGKLIDERAASFSQPPAEPLVYQLPARSSSYVRTLDSILKKPPSSDLISGFVPPSKRPKLPLREKTTSIRERRRRGPRKTRPGLEPNPDSLSSPQPGSVEPDPVPAGQTPSAAPPSEPTTPLTKSQVHKVQPRTHFPHEDPVSPTFKRRRRRLKPKSSSLTLGTSRSSSPSAPVRGDLAPVESDSEFGGAEDRENRRPVMTRALLRQKDLEERAVWEGQSKTSITTERATVALTSLFTLMGFVSENPTAPVQLKYRSPPPCLNDFCRLGCVCPSLNHWSRTAHCGRVGCMFGCSCLKQKVVVLQNLEASDSSPPHHAEGKRRRRKRRKRRMKMAYVLKEADSASQPAKRIRILWRRNDPDPDLILVPEAAPELPSLEVGDTGGCARVRGYTRKQTKAAKSVKRKGPRGKAPKQEAAEGSAPPAPPAEAAAGPVPKAEPPESKLPKRLIIVAECSWSSDADRNHVLKTLCEAMAQDRLDRPFWIKKNLIVPVGQTVEESGAERCLQYKVHITQPKVDATGPTTGPGPAGNQNPEAPALKDQQRAEGRGAEPPEDWQRELEEGDIQEEDVQQRSAEDQSSSVQQRSAEEPDLQEEDESSDQQEAEEEEEGDSSSVQQGSAAAQGDTQDEDESSDQQGSAEEEDSPSVQQRSAEEERRRGLALPFLTAPSPAGFLSARRKEPGGTDHLVQVNGKLYPLAKIQLGKMGALHPANRLAAYLMGRVGTSRRPAPSSSSSSSQLAPPPQTTSVSLASSNPVSVPPPVSTSVPHTHTVSVAPPAAPPAAPRGPVRFPVLTSVLPLGGQRLVLQPTRSPGGAQLYRRADGKLVRLVPITKVRALQGAAPGPPAPGGPPAGPPGLSGPAPLIKIFPGSSSQEPVLITCPRLPRLPPPRPPPPRLTAPGPTVVAPPFKLVQHGPRAPAPPFRFQTVKIHQNLTLVRPPPPPPPPPPPGAELARGPVDLDIICVDDDFASAPGIDPSSSDDTDNSSDFSDEAGEDGTDRPEKKAQRHNLLERQRRGQLSQLFGRLSAAVGLSDKPSKVSILNKAMELISELKWTDAYLKKKKKKLMEKRESLLSTIVPSGDSEHPEETRTKGTKKQSPVANQLPAPDEGGVSEREVTAEVVRIDDDEVIILPANEQPQAQQAPPTAVTNVVAPDDTPVVVPDETPVVVPDDTPVVVPDDTPVVAPDDTPVAPAVLIPVPPSVLQKPRPPQAPPPVVQRAGVAQVRPRTVPNILSRSRKAAVAAPTGETAPPPPALVPGEVLTLLGVMLPTQQVLTLNRPATGPTAAAPGVASGNSPGLTNQEGALGSWPRPPTAEVSNTCGVQTNQPTGPSGSGPAEEQQQQCRPLVAPEGPGPSSDQVPDPVLDQTDPGPPPPSSAPHPDAIVGGDTENLTSLLNEIVFLNQQPVATATASSQAPPPGPAHQQGPALHNVGPGSPSVVAMETEQAEPEGHEDATGAGTTGGNDVVLTPPPLLQMKVGGANVGGTKVGGTKVTDTAGEVAEGGGAEGGAAGREGALAWRPMPRLVPLGRIGTPPS